MKFFAHTGSDGRGEIKMSQEAGMKIGMQLNLVGEKKKHTSTQDYTGQSLEAEKSADSMVIQDY